MLSSNESNDLKKMTDLVKKSYQIRREVLDLVYYGKAGHIGGDYSVRDIMTALYYRVMNVSAAKKDDPDRDRFILSKGHSVESLYCILADLGYFPKEELKTYSQFGSRLIGHPNVKVPGIETNSGSLGHGLSVGVGMALAGRMNGSPYRVYVVMGDGELAEGSVWEAAMAAGHYGLDHLCAVIDRNRLQISGGTEDVMHHDSLDERFGAFGWHVVHAPGNDPEALARTFEDLRNVAGRPSLVIADTTKGCGVSFMENKAVWHHKVPTAEEYALAAKELEERL